MKASIRAILWNDWPALACWIGVPIVWLIYFIFPIIHRNPPVPEGFVWFPMIATTALVGILSWRLFRVIRLFMLSSEVRGQIISVSIVKDRGRLDYSFNYNGESYSCWCPVHKTKRVLSFSRGQVIGVLVDPKAPKKSVVFELFQ